MAEYIIDIPEGTDYWDYQLRPEVYGERRNRIVVIFEIGDRVQSHHIGYTEKSPSQWREFNIEEIQEDGKRKLKIEI